MQSTQNGKLNYHQWMNKFHVIFRKRKHEWNVGQLIRDKLKETRLG